MSNVLTQLVEELNAGRIEVVDLTQPLGPDTPVIGLPPVFASSPGVAIAELSRYDEKGPAWYWNTIRMGEHTGTHFDAPVHWITGKDLPDNRCDTIPARRFVGPACVIDVTREVAADEDFLLTPEHVEAWERRDDERNWRIVDAVRDVAEAEGRTMSQVALNWLLTRPSVAAPIVGARRVEQLEDNLGAVGWRLDDGQLARLEEVSAPPPVHPYDMIADGQRGL